MVYSEFTGRPMKGFVYVEPAGRGKGMMLFLMVITILITHSACLAQDGFRESQQRYPRVRQAYSEKWDLLEELMAANQIRPETMELYLVAYKQEKEFQVWAGNRGEGHLRLLKSYDICTTSGRLGPKRRQGDGQIPEGFYHIRVFNPASSFHLSLGINYPNASDRILSDREHPGGDIYIHGSCVTIGCIPLTDDLIREVYLLCVEARNNGQERIPVTIYPARMETSSGSVLARQDDPDCQELWADLKIAYDLFRETRSMPTITFLPDGRHQTR